MGKKSQGSVHNIPKDRKWNQFIFGYVCGFIYPVDSRGEWFVGKDGLCSGDPDQHKKEKYIFSTEQFAKEFLDNYIKENDVDMEPFVRPYMYETYEENPDIIKLRKRNLVK